MKLELADFPVKQIRLGHRFGYEDRVLEVDEGELIALVLEDTRITDATLAVAVPGERRASPAYAIWSSRALKWRAVARFSPVF